MSGRRRIALLVGIVLFIFLVIGMLLPALPARNYHDIDGYFCADCGLTKWVDETGLNAGRTPLSTSTTFHETPLSLWHREHFGECPHNWLLMGSSHTTYSSFFGLVPLAKVTESVNRNEPSLLRLWDRDRARLEAMFAEDPERTRKYISDNLAARTWTNPLDDE